MLEMNGLRKHTEKSRENLCFSGPPIFRPDLLSLRVLSGNTLCFGNSSSKKDFVRSENSGQPQNGYRKTASERFSANGVHDRLTDNRRFRPGKPSESPSPSSFRKKARLPRQCLSNAKGGRIATSVAAKATSLPFFHADQPFFIRFAAVFEIVSLLPVKVHGGDG